MKNRIFNRVALVVALGACAGAVLATPAKAWANNGAMDFTEAPEQDERAAEKKPGLAFGLSMLGTAAGYGSLMLWGNLGRDSLLGWGLLGVMVGPSLGHAYTGEYGRASIATGLRAGGFTLMIAGLLHGYCFGESTLCDVSPGSRAMFLGGVALFAGSTIYSIVDSGLSARRVNNRHRRRFALTPAPVVGPDRTMGMGMALSATF